MPVHNISFDKILSGFIVNYSLNTGLKFTKNLQCAVMATLTRDMSCSQLFQRLDCEPKNLDKSLGMIKISEKTKEYYIKRRSVQPVRFIFLSEMGFVGRPEV